MEYSCVSLCHFDMLQAIVSITFVSISYIIAGCRLCVSNFRGKNDRFPNILAY